MARFLRTHHCYLWGKNKITIFNPCLWLLLLAVIFLLAGFLTLSLTYQSSLSRSHSAVDVPLEKRVRIFCIIFTYRHLHVHTAYHLRRTWVRHCNHFLFVSDDADSELEPAVFMHINDKWQYMRVHLEYVYKYHFDEGDWFLYVNDNNFVVVENLRYMLQSYNPNDPIYFGCQLRSPTNYNETYMYRGSGIVLSSEALRRFVKLALPDASICSEEDQGEKITEELGRCLTNVNVTAVDSRDPWGRHTFLPFTPQVHLAKGMNASLEKHQYFLERSAYDLEDVSDASNQLFKIPVSRRSICFQVEYLPTIYNFYYFTHKMRVFGLPKRTEETTDSRYPQWF